MKPRRILKIVLFNLALLLVLMEAAALAGYFARTGRLYYLHRPSGRSAPAAFESQVEGYRIHPYLGFIIRPSSGPEDAPGGGYNNYGFAAAVDYPYLRRRPEEILVGIFGGSAASRLAVFEAREQVLSRALAEHLGRRPDDVTVLNFAQGGFKQPQQLLIYTYFRALGQELDLAVGFDGFNDVVLASRNAGAGVALDMPSIDHVRALQEVTAMAHSAAGIERMLRVRSDWSRYSRMVNRAWGGEAWELTFASGFMIDWLIYRFYHQRYLRSRLELTDASESAGQDYWLHLNAPEPPAADVGAAMDRIVELWARSSATMHRSALANGTRYLHFVQPNQYHETARAYGEAERGVAFSDDTPYAEPVRVGYPRLEAAVERLHRDGVPVEGMFRLLDDVDEPVYADDCCHFTDAGQRILLRRIGEVAVVELGRDQ